MSPIYSATMTETQQVRDEKKRAFDGSLFCGHQITDAVRTLSQEISLGPGGTGIKDDQAIQYVYEFNMLLVRARKGRQERHAKVGTPLESHVRYDQLLRDMKHHCEVLEQKD